LEINLSISYFIWFFRHLEWKMECIVVFHAYRQSHSTRVYRENPQKFSMPKHTQCRHMFVGLLQGIWSLNRYKLSWKSTPERGGCRFLPSNDNLQNESRKDSLQDGKIYCTAFQIHIFTGRRISTLCAILL